MANQQDKTRIEMDGNRLTADGKIPTLDFNPVYTRTQRPRFKSDVPKVSDDSNLMSSPRLPIVDKKELPFFAATSQFSLPHLPLARNNRPYASTVTSMLSYPTHSNHDSENKSDNEATIEQNTSN